MIERSRFLRTTNTTNSGERIELLQGTRSHTMMKKCTSRRNALRAFTDRELEHSVCESRSFRASARDRASPEIVIVTKNIQSRHDLFNSLSLRE